MDILKKILICIYNLQGGGAERVLINFLNLIDKKEFKVTLLVLKKEGVYLDKIPSHIKVIYGFKTLFGRKISNKVLKFFDGKILHKIFVKGKFDIEIAFLEGYATKLISGSLHNSRKIAWVHADFKNYHWTNKMFTLDEEKKYYEKFDKIVCVSKMCLKSFKNIFGFEEKLNVIYNVLDKSLESYDKFNFKNVFKEFKTTKIICVGRLEREKGVERLIYAFKDVLSCDNKNVTLFLLGDGSLKEKLEKIVNTNGLSENIKFISFKENVYDYILSSDYVIVPSYSESFCLVIAEAVCLNKVCISTDTVGAREILNNGEYGVLVENSEEGIKNGILKVLNEDFLKDKYESKLLKWSYNFKNESIMEKINELINFEDKET